MRMCRRSRLEEYSHYIIIYRYFESINICCAARLMETAATAVAVAERTDAKSRGKEREKKKRSDLIMCVLLSLLYVLFVLLYHGGGGDGCAHRVCSS